MDITSMFIIIAGLIISSVLITTSGLSFIDNKKEFYDDNDFTFNDNYYSNNYLDYHNLVPMKLRRNRNTVKNNNKNYFGANTKCFSCERQMPLNKVYSSRPTKCFSCENQAGAFGNPTKCFSCRD